MRQEKIKQILLISAAAVVSIALAWGIWLWATYPKAPDVASADLGESMAFMGSDEFNRMFESHRKQFFLDVINKLREKSLGELIAMGMRGEMKDQDLSKNIQGLVQDEEVQGAVLELILDKFYEQPKVQRDLFLTMAVRAEQQKGTGKPSTQPATALDPQSLERGMGQLMEKLSPQVQGKIQRMMLDLRQHRRRLGVADPR